MHITSCDNYLPEIFQNDEHKGAQLYVPQAFQET